MLLLLVSWLENLQFLFCSLPILISAGYYAIKFLYQLYIYRINLATAVQVMATFMSPPPAATFLAFHPQDNNIIAVGMEDSSIQIYNVRVDEVRLLLCFFHSFCKPHFFSNSCLISFNFIVPFRGIIVWFIHC